MSSFDPTIGEEPGSDSWQQEISLDDLAAMQSMEMESQLLHDEQATRSSSAADEAAATAAISATPSLAKKAVSGRYRGRLGAFEVELRVDVDRFRPLRKVSADFYQISGSTKTYLGSFIVHSPTIAVSSSQVAINGLGTFSFSVGNPVVRVTIPRRSVLQPLAPASLQFFSTSGSPGAVYSCAFQSMRFRTVRIETDCVSDVDTPVFNKYDTGSLPSGGPARMLSVIDAFAEAGIEMVATGANNVIDISEAHGNVTWSNAELHASMESHFSLWQNDPSWAVWQLVARQHDLGPSLYGIMFDQQGKQRQGCAVFHRGIGGTTAEKLRLQLYTYVHELGHGFNLLHSWQKSLATPPAPNRPLSLSWMNYPFNYPAEGGEATYWSKFAFQFDNEEVVHLRHAFRNNIIMGGSNFAVGSALDRDVMNEPVRNQSGLTFKISTHLNRFLLGEPVVLQLTLGTNDSNGRRVHSLLHPNYGLVKIAIRKPNGVVLDYEPFVEYLAGQQETVIDRDDVVRDSAYIGYGKDGLYFDQPGNYQVRATYLAKDGSMVISDMLNLRVAYPISRDEDELAELLMGEEQGKLFSLLGSDAPSLSAGNAAFDQVLDRYHEHPLANYVRLVKGINASREFKTINKELGAVAVIRPAQLEDSNELLSVVSESGVLDPVSNTMALSALAEVQTQCGYKEAATETLKRLSQISVTAPLGPRRNEKQAASSTDKGFSQPSYWAGARH